MKLTTAQVNLLLLGALLLGSAKSIYHSNSIFTIVLQLDVVLESNLSTIRVLEAIQKKLQR